MDNYLGIYIHIPFCKRKCNYCAFVSVCDFSLQQDYVKSLINEIKSYANKEEKVSTIYFGGGTPSTLYLGGLTKILSTVRNCFDVTVDAEITVEVNPESFSFEFAKECRECGVNRISMGIQSSSNKYLSLAGRLHDVDYVINAVKTANDVGITNVSGDLIYGFEGQTIENVVDDVKFLTKLPIMHISTYALSVEKDTPFYKSKVRTDDDLQADMYEEISKTLSKLGFERYEVSNFAKNGFISRHNDKYWKRVNYLGFGVSAHSLYNDVRWANTSDVREYINGKTVIERIDLGVKDIREETIMLALRTKDGLNLNYYQELFGVDLLEEKCEQIKRFLDDGFVQLKNGNLIVAQKGIFLLNFIITELI